MVAQQEEVAPRKYQLNGKAADTMKSSSSVMVRLFAQAQYCGRMNLQICQACSRTLNISIKGHSGFWRDCDVSFSMGNENAGIPDCYNFSK